jgi:hypothetical protein
MQDDAMRDAFDLLDRAVGSVCRAEVDGLDDLGVTRRIDLLHRAQSRLAAERARLVAVLEHRRTSQVDDVRQRERARQQIRRELASRSNQAPSQTKLDAQAGAAAQEHTTTGRDFADGRISAEHVRLIAEVLDAVPDGPQRQELERELLGIARVSQPNVLGRHARELLARLVPPSVTLREERQHRERRVSATDTPDGGLALSGIMYGTAAETVRTALEAFRRPDVPGEVRTPGQRTADAVEQLCTSALKAGDAPARHGVRPHVLITVTLDQLEVGEDGLALLASGEPTNLGRLRHLLNDCSWARVVLAPDGTPIEASRGVRTVPKGLWRALLARDGGCTWAGCDAPAAWCDVAHGEVPFAADGQLSPANAALLCRRHHRRFDHGGYRIKIAGDQVTYQRIRDERRALRAPEPASRPVVRIRAEEHRPGNRPGGTPPNKRRPPPSRESEVGPPAAALGQEADPLGVAQRAQPAASGRPTAPEP